MCKYYLICYTSRTMNKTKQDLNYEREDRSDTEVALKVTLPYKGFNKEYKKLLKKKRENVEIKGFRKGNAPMDMVENMHGQEVKQKALNSIMTEKATQVVREEDLAPVAPLSYELEEFDEDEGIVITIVVPVLPDFEIPDVSKLEVEREEVEVTEKEVDDVLDRLWKEHKGDHDNMDDEWVKDIAKKLNFKSETLEDFKKEIEEAVKAQKQMVVEQNFQTALLEKAVEESGLEVPEALLDYEMKQREATFQDQLKKMNIDEEQFCKIRNVTMEDLKKQWKKDSLKALEQDVFLLEFAKQHDVEVEEDELEAEVNMIRSKNPDAPEETFDNPTWRSYIQRVVLKRKAFRKFMEEAGELKVEGQSSGSKTKKKSKKGDKKKDEKEQKSKKKTKKKSKKKS